VGNSGGSGLAGGGPECAGDIAPLSSKGIAGILLFDPSTEVPFTHPPELGDQIREWMPDFMMDVPNFRSDEKQRILDNLYALCDQRFTLASKLIARDALDFLMLVDMGVDRIHHAFWKPMDPRHPQYEPESPFVNAIHDYYVHVDRQVGELLSQCDDGTAVLVVSDHGAQPLMGGICINEWLMANGYLTLKQVPSEPTALDKVAVDWSQTQVWGAGGYYARIFLNVKGREPEGTIAMADYERVRDELTEKLQTLPDPNGKPLNVKVFKPQQIYQKVRGRAPDLIVYFDDLAWRSVVVWVLTVCTP
jgi:predicted AlkP superfamily phosphohydrolase/phosphomutase